MEKIYSRKRIKLPTVNGGIAGKNNTKFNKVKNIFFILFIAYLTAFLLINNINPVFNGICKEKARAIATEILNVESSKILRNVDYEDLVSVIKDNDGNITMIKINTTKINTLAAEIAYNIQQELYKVENNSIYMPLRKHYRK